MNKTHPAYKYAADVIARRTPAPKYVKIQCRLFRDMAGGKDKKYIIDNSRVALIDEILKLMIMPKGLRQGQSLDTALSGFQWLFIIAVLCAVHRDTPKRRRYQKAVLEIARKNGKTLLVAIVFLLCMLLEPDFSRLYSVAPDGSLSREIQTALRAIIASSPALVNQFKLRRDDILCLLTSS